MDKVVIVTDVPKTNSESSAQSVWQSIDQTIELLIRNGIENEVIEIDDVTENMQLIELIALYAKHPEAKFLFNVTGGRKPIALSLMLASIWTNGICYYIPEAVDQGMEDVLEIKIPKMHINDIRQNSNYNSYLNILLEYKESDKEDGWMSRKELTTKMEKLYRPQRRTSGKMKMSFSSSMMTKWTAQLEEWALIEVNYSDNRREKIMRLTDDGVFAVKLLKATKV